MPNDAPASLRYELRIHGHLDRHWSTWFGGLALTCEDDGTTTLRGTVTDQAELHGLLARVRDLGVTLISLTSIDPAHDHDHPKRRNALVFGASGFIGRWLVKELLSPMVAQGLLAFTIPSMEKHPEQRYTARATAPASPVERFPIRR